MRTQNPEITIPLAGLLALSTRRPVSTLPTSSAHVTLPAYSDVDHIGIRLLDCLRVVDARAVAVAAGAGPADPLCGHRDFGAWADTGSSVNSETPPISSVGEPGDLALLGARTLEGLNLRVDTARKKLVAAGPVPAAALSRCGQSGRRKKSGFPGWKFCAIDAR